jgi:WXG100 family type VII secretion target
MALVVTPEVLRSTQQAIESALEHATAIKNGYLSNHEALAVAVWGGQAKTASVQTATEIDADMQKVINGATRLAHGLSQASSMMEQHEADAAHSLTSFAANA